eukprot:779993-Amphidinium_carterae.1
MVKSTYWVKNMWSDDEPNLMETKALNPLQSTMLRHEYRQRPSGETTTQAANLLPGVSYS